MAKRKPLPMGNEAKKASAAWVRKLTGRKPKKTK
jgi:hypothetical protein